MERAFRVYSRCWCRSSWEKSAYRCNATKKYITRVTVRARAAANNRFRLIRIRPRETISTCHCKKTASRWSSQRENSRYYSLSPFFPPQVATVSLVYHWPRKIVGNDSELKRISLRREHAFNTCEKVASSWITFRSSLDCKILIASSSVLCLWMKDKAQVFWKIIEIRQILCKFYCTICNNNTYEMIRS